MFDNCAKQKNRNKLVSQAVTSMPRKQNLVGWVVRCSLADCSKLVTPASEREEIELALKIDVVFRRRSPWITRLFMCDSVYGLRFNRICVYERCEADYECVRMNQVRGMCILCLANVFLMERRHFVCPVGKE